MKQIVCFGDSNTYGYIPGQGGRFDEQTRWTALLAQKLASKGYEVIEQGCNGRTTVFDDPKSPERNGSKVLERLFKTLPQPSHMIIMLGTNDCKRQFHADAADITEGMALLVSMIHLYWVDTEIWLLSPAPLAEGAVEEANGAQFSAEGIRHSHELAAHYRELARTHNCHFLCVGDLVSVDPSDGVHLNAASHRKLAEALEGLLAPQIP